MAVTTNPLVTGIATPLRLLYGTTTAVTTAGTSEETVASYTLKGGTLAGLGQHVHIFAAGNAAANANNKTFKVSFGGTDLINSTVGLNGSAWLIEGRVGRITAATQIGLSWFARANSYIGPIRLAPAETLTGDVTITCKLTTASAAGDATLEQFYVFLAP